jgi:putative hydrolase of the HAD superfamily
MRDSNTKASMIKAFIFDFGGVLVRTEDYSPRHAWDQRLGVPTGTVERVVHYSDLWIQAQLGRVAPQRYWRGVAEMLYMRDMSLIEDLRRDFYSGDRLNYRVVQLARDIKDRGFPVALLSNDSIELEGRLRALELDTLFDPVLISARIGVMKPDLTAYRVTLQTLDVAPDEALFVDDSIANVRAAQSMGIQAVLFRAELDLRAELEQRLNMDAE